MMGKGHPCSEEAKKKISQTLTGHEVDEETRNKISKTLTGKKLSPERVSKIKEQLKGNQHTKDFHWYTDGNENRLCKESPGPEWHLGRVVKKLSA